MAINKFMRLALKALSYPDIDIRKTYQFERSFRYIKSPPVFLPLYRRHDHVIESGGREILTRVYTPQEDTAEDTLLFFHGGGWVTENIDTYNGVCRALARASGCRVVSVEYRLAPEHPFPDGLDDCYAAARELLLHPESFDFDPGRVALVGDSAGGNLAAAVSLRARDEGEFSIPRQILIYPSTYPDHSENSPFPSVAENGSDYLLTSRRICEYIDLYKRDDGDLANPYFAPLLAEDFSNLPDTLVITAEFDPLRDEGEEYARRLLEAGNRVTCYRMKDALHGFLSLGAGYVHVRRAHELIYSFLNRRESNGENAELAETR